MDDDQLRAVFRYGLTKLSIDDDGLTRDGNDPRDLKTLMVLAAAIKASTTDGATTLQALHWHRTACLTENLIQAWGFPDRALTRQWLISRGELLAVEIQ